MYEHLIYKVNNVILIYQEKVYFVQNIGQSFGESPHMCESMIR